jgi:HD-like signal output (HDOD) protein
MSTTEVSASLSNTIQRTIENLQGVSCVYAVVRKCIDALEDPQVMGRQIEQILGADPGLAARVLKLANSAYFGISGRVSTLTMAVGVIGHRRLRLMLERILIAEMLGVLKTEGEPAASIREFGVIAAAVSCDLAAATWIGDPEEMLMVGLLHNVGDLVLASQFPEQRRQIDERAPSSARYEAEETVLGVESGQVGGWLLDGWLFPPIYGAACRHWKAPLEYAEMPDLNQRLCVIHAAAHVTRAFVEGCDSRAAFQAIQHEVAQVLEVNQEMIVSLYEEVPGCLERARGVLSA